MGRGLHVTFGWRGQKRVLESFVLVSGILLGISESLVSRQVLKLLFRREVSILDSLI